MEIYIYDDGTITLTDKFVYRKGLIRQLQAEGLSDALRMIAEHNSVYGTFAAESMKISDVVNEAVQDGKDLEISDLRVQTATIEARLKQQEAWADVQNNVISAYTKLLRRIMSTLAIQNAVQNTHRERNAENTQLVRSINNELTNPIDHYFTDTYRAIDDIPF